MQSDPAYKEDLTFCLWGGIRHQSLKQGPPFAPPPSILEPLFLCIPSLSQLLPFNCPLPSHKTPASAFPFLQLKRPGTLFYSYRHCRRACFLIVCMSSNKSKFLATKNPMVNIRQLYSYTCLIEKKIVWVFVVVIVYLFLCRKTVDLINYQQYLTPQLGSGGSCFHQPQVESKSKAANYGLIQQLPAKAATGTSLKHWKSTWHSVWSRERACTWIYRCPLYILKIMQVRTLKIIYCL